nr:MAG TPA: hypothetical protein [Bacteriophage sp.]
MILTFPAFYEIFLRTYEFLKSQLIKERHRKFQFCNHF